MSVLLNSLQESRRRDILDSPNKIPVFVYGTLKGMQHGKLLGPASTIHKFFMYDGNYPVVWNGKAPPNTILPFHPEINRGRIKGECYLVSVREFDALDTYEGFPHLYTREMTEVKVDLGDEVILRKAWIYVTPEDGTGSFESLHHRRPVEPDDLGYLQWPTLPF